MMPIVCTNGGVPEGPPGGPPSAEQLYHGDRDTTTLLLTSEQDQVVLRNIVISQLEFLLPTLRLEIRMVLSTVLFTHSAN